MNDTSVKTKRILTESKRRTINGKISRIIVSRKGVREKGSASRLPPIQTPPLSPVQNRSQRLNNNLDENLAREVYQAKCRYLEICENDLGEKRFIDQFLSSISQKSLHFSNLGLPPPCAEILFDCLLTSNFFNIDLSFNGIGDGGAYALAQLLYRNTSIIALDLRSNSISSKGMVHLFTALRRNDKLSYLNIGAVNGINRNRMEIDSAIALRKCLISNKILSEIDMTSCGLTPESLTEIGMALSFNDSLTILNLSSNNFGSDGLKALLETENALSNIEKLDLSHNSIGNGGSQLLFRQLRQNKCIKTLDLSFNNCGKPILKALHAAFQEGCEIENLSLARNSFGKDCTDTIEILLKSAKFLQNLNFSKNKLYDSMINQLIDPIVNCECLLSLDLSDCNMNDNGAESISQIILRSGNIQKINLSKNKITSKGGIHLIDALMNNTVITEFSLRNNELKDDAADSVTNLLVNNMQIIVFDVQYNDFSYEVFDQIQRKVSEHQKIIEQNIKEFAKKHIDHLEEKDRQLHEIKAELSSETKSFQNSTDQYDQAKNIFQQLQESRNAEIDNLQKILNESNEKLERLQNEHSEKTSELIFLKNRADTEVSKLNGELQSRQMMAQHMTTRAALTEERLASTRGKSNKELDDLKMHFEAIKAELKELIEDTLHEQEFIEEQELAAEDEVMEKGLNALQIADQEDHPANVAIKNIVKGKKKEIRRKKKADKEKRKTPKKKKQI